MLKTVLLTAGLGILLTAPARADWQYTKWGMTPEEAVKASKGAMKLIPAKDRGSPSPMGTLKVADGTFQDGEFRLEVEFLGDAKSGGLVCVTYTWTDDRQLPAFRQMMIKRYGVPKGGDSGRAKPVDMLAWEQPDTIQYAEASQSGGVIHCKKGGPMG